MTLRLFAPISCEVPSFCVKLRSTHPEDSLYTSEFPLIDSVDSMKSALGSWVNFQHVELALHLKILTIPQNHYSFQISIAPYYQIGVRVNGAIQR